MINDNQTVGDACLAYYYLHSNKKDEKKEDKYNQQPRFIASVDIEKLEK